MKVQLGENVASLKWYISRAKVMNCKEIHHRIICKYYDNKLFFGKRLKQERYGVKYIDLFKFRGCTQSENDILLLDAENILNDKIVLFNQLFQLNYNEKFLRDPFTKKKWNNDIYTKVNFRKENLPGDPKLIWEINKQQYLIDLGLAYQLTNNKKYAKKIIEEINEWINQNEEYKGINWTSGLEISLRALSWIYSLSLIKKYINDYEIEINNILHYIRIQTEFVFNKLSLYSSGNNHLIGELTLILQASFFINCKESTKWKKKAVKMLNQEINNQFYNDGVNKEQSVNYQIHTMELYFLNQYLLNKNDETLNKKTLDILKKSCMYLNNLSERNGLVFNIGDEDGGHILKLQTHKNKILDILQIGALVLNDLNIYSQKNKEINYKVLMLYGEEYEKLYEKISKNDYIENTYVFEEGGMFIKDGIINKIKYKASFDFGKIGMEPLNAHAHCDIFSFNLNINEKPFLIDTGTYKYHDEYRNYFRGVQAHNTISIDDCNQFEFLGPFLSGKSPKVKVENISKSSIKCSSDMYKKLKCNVTREIIFKNKYILIIDTVENISSSSKNVKIYFNFDHKVKINKISNKDIFIVGENKIIFENLLSQDKIEVTKKIDEKWKSDRYYKKEKSNVLIYEKNVNSKETIKNIIKISFGG